MKKVAFRAVAVVTFAVGVPEEDVAVKKLARSVTEPRECPKKTYFEKSCRGENT